MNIPGSVVCGGLRGSGGSYAASEVSELLWVDLVVIAWLVELILVLIAGFQVSHAASGVCEVQLFCILSGFRLCSIYRVNFSALLDSVIWSPWCLVRAADLVLSGLCDVLCFHEFKYCRGGSEVYSG
mmetsp:Transcript_14951/g.60965  ORF Transcript_14951/g.60965 Transcript_14951/m.60965 type:complete len:127 (-) Transcript_14951:1660-2040(-)